MSAIKILGFILALLFGAFMFVYGGIDDSPGGQLIGLLIIIISMIKGRKIVSSSPSKKS